MTEEEYKQEWLAGKHQSVYNSCRFAEDKVQYCKDWLKENVPWANVDNPSNVVDIICKQKLRIATDEKYCDLCSKWADKYYAQSHIAPELKIPTPFMHLGGPIDFDTCKKYLQPGMIVKMTHGSGWNIKVNTVNDKVIEHVVQKIAEWSNLKYAYIAGYEAQYEKMPAGVLFQKILVDTPTDYGFWCINGNIEGISLTKKLGKNLEEYIAFVDKEGKQNPWYIGVKPAMDNLNKKQKEMIDSMIPYVEIMAKPFDFVRVDFYYVGGRPYFGEMTFTPCSGRLDLGTIGG